MSRSWSSSSAKRLTFLGFLVCLLSRHPEAFPETICERVNGFGCQFRCHSGKDVIIIDISTIDGNHGDPPRFVFIQDANDTAITYMWNPCRQFNFTQTCTGVNVCQLRVGKEPSNFGNEGPTLGFDRKKKQYYLSYLGPVKKMLGERETIVHLEYNNESIASTSKMQRAGNYLRMTLYTKHAPYSRAQSGSSGESERLSTGTILLITFLCVTFLYLATGMTIKYRRGDRGKEVIPHFMTFWSKLPGLAKDGCLHTAGIIQKLGSRFGRDSGYEQV